MLTVFELAASLAPSVPALIVLDASASDAGSNASSHRRNNIPARSSQRMDSSPQLAAFSPQTTSHHPLPSTTYRKDTQR